MFNATDGLDLDPLAIEMLNAKIQEVKDQADTRFA